MNKTQWITLGSALVLLMALAFVFPTKPKKLIQEEKTRSLNTKATDIFILKKEALDQLEAGKASRFRLLENQLSVTEDTLDRIELLKGISGEWYAEGHYAIAGDFAEEIAELTGDPADYNIAATTYAIGIKKAAQEKEQSYCRSLALEMIEKTISINPEDISAQINRAVILADHPDPNNPMSGILLLLDLNKKYPKNVSVMNNLAKFALQTNQLDKAEERLATAEALDPTNNVTICLLAQLYEIKGDASKAALYSSKCSG